MKEHKQSQSAYNILSMKVILFSILCSVNALFAQTPTIGLSLSDLKAPPQYLTIFSFKKNSSNANNRQTEQKTPRPIPLVFCVETLPFFCKIEHKMGLNQKLPLKFRLGDVQYVDELEGKRRAN
jgi:hypothetical protein